MRNETALWSAQQWQRWITEQRKTRERIFALSPDELVASYNREDGYTRDYRGRELLELIQNADDAFAQWTGESKVAIILTKHGLFVANTGQPFSAAGITSLIISNNSPKQLDRTRYIGNRGLGFRSILNLSESPMIFSGELSVGFSQTYARQWLEMLCQNYPEIQQKVAQRREHNEPWPISTLSVPFILDQSTIEQHFLSKDIVHSIQQITQSLLNQGYDTVIALPFKNEHAYTEVIRQIRDLGKETLLFLKHLQQLHIDDGKNAWTWKAERADTLITVQEGEELEYWHIHRDHGAIPIEYLRDRDRTTAEYEITLAIPSNERPAPNLLFSYFRTRVTFPFPLVAHITMELTDNREAIARTDANKFLVGKLAELMVAAAEHPENRDSPWAPLSLLTPTKDGLDPLLSEYGLMDAIVVAARDRVIIPTYGGEWRTPMQACLLNASATWLPLKGFEDITLRPNKIFLQEVLNQLKVENMSSTELCTRLNLITDSLSINQRAIIIAELIKSNLLPRNPAPELLVDANSTIVHNTKNIFFPPDTDYTDLPIFPDWIELRLINPDLGIALREMFEIKSYRELRSKLSPWYSIYEYAFNTIISRVQTQISERITPESDSETQLDCLRLLYSLYLLRANNDEAVPNWPQELAPPLVPDQHMCFKYASSLYLSQDYPDGHITDALYRHFDSGKLIANPEMLGLGDDLKKITAFLRWVGVETQPREQLINIEPNNPFFEFVLSTLTYPLNIPEVGVFNKGDTLPEAAIVNVVLIDRFDHILEHAEPEAILAWIATDTRLASWRKQNKASIVVKNSHQKKFRDLHTSKPLPFYMFWKLQHTSWIRTTSGEVSEPGICVLDHSLVEDLAVLFPQPALIEHPIFSTLNLEQRDIHQALEWVGVQRSLAKLPAELAYNALLKHPKIDPSGKFAKLLYRTIVKNIDDADPMLSVSRQRFIDEGRLLGRQGNETVYLPIYELRYIASVALPDVVTRNIWLLDFDRRQGAKQIELIFGVKAIDFDQFNLRIDECDKSNLNERFRAELQQLKPYIYALRLNANIHDNDLARMQDFDIEFCQYAIGEASVAGQKIEISLEKPNDRLFDDQNRKGYLIESKSSSSFLLNNVLIANAVGELIGNLLRIEAIDKFGLLAACHPDERLQFLVEELGDEVEAERLLRQARERLSIVSTNAEEFISWVPSTGQTVKDAERSILPSNKPNGDSVSHTEKSSFMPLSEESPEFNAIFVDEKQWHPLQSRTEIGFRITSRPASTGQTRQAYQITDGQQCEELAIVFEEHQGRFPLLSAHLTGWQAPGCDILSFVSAEQRDLFRETKKSDLIERFIEVKGRSTARGMIQLTKNEITAAKKYGTRYWIYRVYELPDESFEIVTISNPSTLPPSAITYDINQAIDQEVRSWLVTPYSTDKFQ